MNTKKDCRTYTYVHRAGSEPHQAKPFDPVKTLVLTLLAILLALSMILPGRIQFSSSVSQDTHATNAPAMR